MTRMTVNGEAIQYKLDPETPLLFALRDASNLTGTKHGCYSGDCGLGGRSGQPMRTLRSRLHHGARRANAGDAQSVARAAFRLAQYLPLRRDSADHEGDSKGGRRVGDCDPQPFRAFGSAGAAHR